MFVVVGFEDMFGSIAWFVYKLADRINFCTHFYCLVVSHLDKLSLLGLVGCNSCIFFFFFYFLAKQKQHIAALITDLKKSASYMLTQKKRRFKGTNINVTNQINRNTWTCAFM
jgi:hypothetical protein